MKEQASKLYEKYFLFASLFCLGYVTSLFLTYSFIVMPALAGLDDPSFVAAFQGLETRFQNAENLPGYQSFGYGNIPAFIAFPGSIIFTIIVGFLTWKTSDFKWTMIALALFLIGMIATVIYNLPANYKIFAAGDPKLIDATLIRKNFDEKMWLNANHFRSMTSLLATICITRIIYRKVSTDK